MTESLQDMVLVMCKALVVKTVVINWRAPIWIDTVGEAYLDEHGIINFDIDPNQSAYGIYRTALHEVGHCLSGHLKKLEPRTMPDSIKRAYEKKGPILERTEQQKDEYENDPQEVEARNVENELDRIAKNRSLFLFGDDGLENRIAILSKVHIVKPEAAS